MILWVAAVAGSALVLTQSSLTEGMRAFLLKHVPILGKLASCPMCSGFWLGMAWAWGPILGRTMSHGAPWQSVAGPIAQLFACISYGFAGSVASALTVALWLALGEAYAALGLYRFMHSPGGPSDGKARIPKHMKPAFANDTPRNYVCTCGESVCVGCVHVMGPRCEPTET